MENVFAWISVVGIKYLLPASRYFIFLQPEKTELTYNLSKSHSDMILLMSQPFFISCSEICKPLTVIFSEQFNNIIKWIFNTLAAYVIVQQFDALIPIDPFFTYNILLKLFEIGQASGCLVNTLLKQGTKFCHWPGEISNMPELNYRVVDLLLHH